MLPLPLLSLLTLPLSASAQTKPTYSATYTYSASGAPQPSALPSTTETNQFGTNDCGTTSGQASLCQNAFINDVDDFCLWGPPYSDGKNASIGETERIEVSWCTKSGRGTRLFPDGTLTSAHFVKTPHYVQVTGTGDFTKIGVPAGDQGGELDPHGADGNGNPIGGLVFSSAFSNGSLVQVHEWMTFMSAVDFCFRACVDGNMSTSYCKHTYDELGCAWNMPANYTEGIFESCDGDDDAIVGVYTSYANGGSYTGYFDQTMTLAGTPIPDPSPAASSSNCRFLSGVSAGAPTSSPSSSASSTSTSSHSTTAPATTAAGSSRTPSSSATVLLSPTGGSGSSGAANNGAVRGVHLSVIVVSGAAAAAVGVVAFAAL